MVSLSPIICMDPDEQCVRYSSEGLTRAQALKGMTLDPAYASFSEREIGSLEVGKKADFVVLDRNIMQVPIGEVLETKVKATVVDGKVLFGALERRQIRAADLWWGASKYAHSRLVSVSSLFGFKL